MQLNHLHHVQRGAFTRAQRAGRATWMSTSPRVGPRVLDVAQDGLLLLFVGHRSVERGSSRCRSPDQFLSESRRDLVLQRFTSFYMVLHCVYNV